MREGNAAARRRRSDRVVAQPGLQAREACKRANALDDAAIPAKS